MGFVVEVEERTETGKNASRRLRAQRKMVPGVVYGNNIDPISVIVDPKELLRILHSDSGRNTIFDLNVGEVTNQVLIRELQVHPVKGTILHADFVAVAMDRKMEFEVPIEILGKAKGVREDGGILEIILRDILIECLPGDVPESFEIDVSELGIGDLIHISDLKVDESKIEVLADPEVVVLTVAPPAMEEEVEEEIAVEEAAEPEVIGKGKEEGEEKEAKEE